MKMKPLFTGTTIISVLLLTYFPLKSAEGRDVTIFGGSSCIEWQRSIADERKLPTSSYRGYSAALEKAWLIGFVSGYNAASPVQKNLLAAIDPETIYIWMDKYCKENPKNDVYDGAGKMFEELNKITK